MQLFLDTASLEEIEIGAKSGLIDGVTTNPSLLAKENISLKEAAEKICSIISGPVSLEVISTKWEEMIKEGLELSQLAPNVVVKLPTTPDGLKATKYLSSQGVKVNNTLIFQPLQALLAAKAGAFFVSPFIGRKDDIAEPSYNLIQDIVTIFKNYTFSTQVLVASVRHPLHVLNAAKIGAHICTLPFKVFNQLFKHPQTDLGLEKFLNDWKKNTHSF